MTPKETEQVKPDIMWSEHNPYVYCPFCQATFRTDPMDAVCRLCNHFYRDMKHLGDTTGPLLKELTASREMCRELSEVSENLSLALNEHLGFRYYSGGVQNFLDLIKKAEGLIERARGGGGK